MRDQREIKFRALNALEQYMHENLTIENISRIRNPANISQESVSLIHSFDELIWMQYTGLKDKHGKEIYEGDIIQDVIVGMKSEVVFTDYANFGIKSLEGISDLEYDVIDPSWTSTSVIIIGTIYENPELCQK